MHPLIIQLLKDDAEAWAEFWMRFDQVAGRAIRRIVHKCGFDLTEAEDVAQECWLLFHARNYARLRRCRATNDAQLVAFLVKVAANFTRDWVTARIRSRRRERRALANAPKSDRRGPTEADIESLLDALHGIASDGDIEKLRVLAGLDDAALQPGDAASSSILSPRTIRRLQKRFRDEHWGEGI